jgi:hypothetical protein
MLYFGRVGSSWRHCAFFGSSWGKKVITPKKKIGEEDAYFFFLFSFNSFADIICIFA